MRRILFFAMTVSIFASCNKSNSGGSSSSLPMDTLYNWVKGAPGGAQLNDVWFLNRSTGYVLGNNSLFISTDSGVTFSAVLNTGNFTAFNLQFTDSLNGFAQGNTQLDITADGGKTWITKNLLTTTGYTFQFISPTLGFYNDYNLGIYKTTNAGSSWNQVVNGTNLGPNFVFNFVDSLHGFVMINGVFSKTADGGISWALVSQTSSLSSFNGFYTMTFKDTLNGYCASPLGLYKTADGGITWTDVLAVQSNFMVPFFIDKNNGYCLSANAIYETTDGGSSWTGSCKLGVDSFTGMYFLDMNTGWATTAGGYVLRLKP